MSIIEQSAGRTVGRWVVRSAPGSRVVSVTPAAASGVQGSLGAAGAPTAVHVARVRGRGPGRGPGPAYASCRVTVRDDRGNADDSTTIRRFVRG